MLASIFALSSLISVVILIRAIFKKRVSAKLTYALWITVIIRLCIPFNLVSVELPIPEISEIRAYFTDSADTAVQEEIPIETPSEVLTPSPAPTPESTVPPPVSDTNTESNVQSPDLEAHIPPAEITTEAVSKLSTEDIMRLIWLCGSIVTLTAFAVPILIKAVKIRRSRIYHSTVGKTQVYISDRIASPCVMGIIPTIYITPVAASCKDLSLILKHEKTHIRHGDHVWAIIRILFLVILWWNPFVWTAALLSKRDAEVACDEQVAKSMDEKEKLVYTRLIVDMIPQRGGFVVAFSNKPIKYRVLRLTGKFRTTVIAAVVTTVTIVLACLFAFVSNGVHDGQTTLMHIHNFDEEATCTTAKKCDCGETKGSPRGHKWQKASCTAPKTCKRCKLTEGAPLEHTWLDATCDSAKTCSACKKTVGTHLEHVFIEATCTSPKYCSLCNKVEGDELGHDLIDATCTSPVTCTRCPYTEGEALSHNYNLGVCTRCSNVDTAFYDSIRSKFYSPYNGYSKKSATKTLSELGYNAEQTEFILATLNIDWYEQALIASRYYVNNMDSYIEEKLISNIRYLGFTQEEIDYAVKIAMEEKPPQHIKIVNDYNYPDFETDSHGNWDFMYPWDYSKPDFGGYNGEPISWGDPYSNIDKKPSYNTGYGYRPGFGYRP
ncbi:MAG: hypothetical protein IJF69_02265 [Clostridia bacterium]|nr:hypothetical protein [Clostridia bacterium]